MDRKLVGEPGVSAFLQSVRQNLDGHISRMKPNYTTYLYYDHTQDLEKLNQKLVFFQDLLVDGEARRLGEVYVDEWMDDIKHLLNDIEDILDDLQSVSNDQVRVHQLYITSHEKEKRLIKILNRTDVLRDRAKDLKLKRGGGYGLKVTLRTPETSSVVDKSEIMHGRDEDKKDIVKRMLEVDDEGKENYDVLGIVGMGGLGKTTLAKQVFDDLKAEKHFDVTSWVCISNVFDVARATKELIVNSGSQADLNSLESLQSRLREIVEKKKFLFVLDDVWSSKEWEKMKAPLSLCANGSKILVTTRNKQIALDFGNKNPHQMQELDHEECKKLFRRKAFGDDKGEEKKDSLVEEIVEACKGVPLVAKVIGSMLRFANVEKWLAISKCKEIFKDKAFRDDKGWEQKKEDLVEEIVKACKGVPLVIKVIGSMLRFADAEKWQAVSKNVANLVNENDEIHPAIRFSYYDLPCFLKRCFEYLAMFPPDFMFYQEWVVRLWIADGLVQDVDGRKAEDIGAEYYNELKARSLIQKHKWKRDKMHDIVHHLASVVSRKFCYKENWKNSPARVRHAFVGNWEGMHHEFLAQAPCLRTLILPRWLSKNDVEKIFLSSKMLRTLKIGDDYCVRRWNLSLGGSVVDHLTHIRYLRIPRSDRHLWDSLCMLKNLLFIAINESKHLRNLPDGMNHLSNLRLLRVGQSPMLSLPGSICALSELQILDLYGCNSLTELPKDIGNLRSLRNLYLPDTAISSLPESICALSELQILDLNGCESLSELPKDIGNLRSLRNLYLRDTAISSLPESICALTELQILDLIGCESLTELPKDIGNLRSLRNLYLQGTAISSLPESICALSEMQILDLNGCESLTELPKDLGNLKSLQELDLGDTSISSLPESIGNLRNLQKVTLIVS